MPCTDGLEHLLWQCEIGRNPAEIGKPDGWRFTPDYATPGCTPSLILNSVSLCFTVGKEHEESGRLRKEGADLVYTAASELATPAAVGHLTRFQVMSFGTQRTTDEIMLNDNRHGLPWNQKSC